MFEQTQASKNNSEADPEPIELPAPNDGEIITKGG